MKKSTKVCIGIFAVFIVIIAATAAGLIVAHENNLHSMLHIILDTDIGPWPDDVAALAYLHSYADHNKLELLAVMANNAYEGIVAVIDAMNTYFNRTHIPIGITKDSSAVRDQGVIGWPQYVVDNFPHPNYQLNSQAYDAVKLYRKVLADADDYSVTILSIGYFNNLANLLKSPSDEYSDLNGRQLIELKVRNLVAMAGEFPSGAETNIRDQIEAASGALLNWPTPVTFSGEEIGRDIECGLNLIDPNNNNITYMPKSPVGMMFQMAYQYDGDWTWGHYGCYDPTAALITVRGVQPMFENVPGMIGIDPVNGTNWWVVPDDPKLITQSYIRQVQNVDTIKDTINKFIYR